MAQGFATAVELGAFLKLPIADDDATRFLLDYASDMIRDYLGQQVDYVANDVVTLDPYASSVVLPELPVLAVTKVETTLDGILWTVADPGLWQATTGTGGVTLTPLGYGRSWPTKRASWRVTYTHGYQVIPNTIKGVTLSVAARLYESPVPVDMERIGGYQVKPMNGFTHLEEKALGRYRVVTLA